MSHDVWCMCRVTLTEFKEYAMCLCVCSVAVGFKWLDRWL